MKSWKTWVAGIIIFCVLMGVALLIDAYSEKASPTPTIQTDEPTMSALEVCQYVNQALPNEYVYRTPALRYEYHYTALSTQYIGGSSHKNVWEVSVRETVEYQRLYEGQWTLFSGGSPVSQTVKYILNEATGAVTRK